ncbi:MAG: flagellar biosynthesis anti-sigma factor FlgM [Acidobacteria bacterium]|nr:MAG: flagellar biosynthesis anti-sigma factor FlgM [Acidobacteriota bacterium]
MAIDGISGKNGPLGVDPTETRPNGGDKTKPKPITREQDRVSLSQDRQEFARIRELVDQLPDVRSARIEELARVIHRGAYEVDALDLADAIIQKNWINLMG